MEKPDILILRPYEPSELALLDSGFNTHILYEADDQDAFIRERSERIRGIATRGEWGASRELIEALPNLEVISVYGVGYDSVDLDAAREHGVRVTNTPDVLNKDVADLAILLMLGSGRDVIGAEKWVRSGAWLKAFHPLKTRVSEKRAGIFGLGRIGTEIAKRCAAFDMDIAYSARSERNLDNNWAFIQDPVELAERSDFLFVTVTGGADTKHIIDKKTIEALGPKGTLINVSRASNIDEEALLDALESKALGYAALDVFEGEPAINPRFLELDNVLLSPHQGSGTFETRRAMIQLVFDNLTAQFAGDDLPTPVI